MQDVIIKNILGLVGRVDLPTNSDELNEMFKSNNIDIHDMFHILSKYEPFTDIYIDCIYAMLKYGEFNKTLFDTLITHLTQGFEDGKITESTYYQLIQFAIDENSYTKHYIRTYLKIIDKCNNKFIQKKLGKSISTYYIGYHGIKQYHHLIDWEVFQQHNNIYEILSSAAENENNENILKELITEDYYLNSLDYNLLLRQQYENHDDVEDSILITMLELPHIFKIDHITVVNYCINAYSISNRLIKFLIESYRPLNQYYLRFPRVDILCVFLNRFDKKRLRTLILKYESIFFKYVVTQDLIRKMFRWDLKISWKLMTIKPIDR